MPHVVLEGPLRLREIYESFQPRIERRGEELLKFESAWLSHDGHALLVETLAVAGALRQKYFLRLSGKGEGVTIRLEPMTDPEKTPAVKRSLAAFAAILRAGRPDLRIGATNIAEYLEP